MALHNYIYFKHSDSEAAKIARPEDPRPYPLASENDDTSSSEGSGQSDNSINSRPEEVQKEEQCLFAKERQISAPRMVNGLGVPYPGVQQSKPDSLNVTDEEAAKGRWVIRDGKRRRLRSRFSKQQREVKA